MNGKFQFKELTFASAWIFFFAFLLNFLWESLHGFSLYKDHHIDSDIYVRMMVYMSAMDALTIVGMFLFIGLWAKNMDWVRQFNNSQVVSFLFLGLIVAMLAEYRAVYVTGEWSYNALMPLVFGIGLSPLFQLSATGWLAIWLARRLL